MTSLGEFIDAVETLPQHMTVYAHKPWTIDSVAYLRDTSEIVGSDTVLENGARYVLEVFLIVEVLEDTFGPEWRSVPLIDRCNRVIEYAINDA
jgi:hypothetical protein